MEIPEELESFLVNQKELAYDPAKCECGQVTLVRFEDLEVDAVWIDASSKNSKSYYEIPAISLLESCEYYDPEFVLLWLPNENIYGAWDSDHWQLLVFPEVNWGDITKDPVIYLNSQWHDYRNEYSKKFDPEGLYAPIYGWPI